MPGRKGGRHLLEGQALPVGAGRAARLAIRAPLPKDVAYRLRHDPDAPPPRSAPGGKRRSMFFRARALRPKDDPFLQRLSRLQ